MQNAVDFYDQMVNYRIGDVNVASNSLNLKMSMNDKNYDRNDRDKTINNKKRKV